MDNVRAIMKKNLMILLSLKATIGILALTSCQSIEKLNDPNYKNRDFEYSSYRAPEDSKIGAATTKVLAAVSLNGLQAKPWLAEMNTALTKQNIDLFVDSGLSKILKTKVKKSKRKIKESNSYFQKLATVLKEAYASKDEDQAIETAKALLDNYVSHLKNSNSASEAFSEAMFWAAVNTLDKSPKLFEDSARFYSATVPSHLVRKLETQVSPSILARIYSTTSKTAKLKVAGSFSKCKVLVNGQKISKRNVVIPSGVESVLTSTCGPALSYATSFKVKNYITIRNSPSPTVQVTLPNWNSMKSGVTTQDKGKRLALYLFRDHATGYLYLQAIDTKSGEKLVSSQMVTPSKVNRKTTVAWIGRQIKLAQSKIRI